MKRTFLLLCLMFMITVFTISAQSPPLPLHYDSGYFHVGFDYPEGLAN